MGLHVSILRSDSHGNTSNGGVSSQASSLTIINIDGPFEPTEDAPAAILKEGRLGTVIVVPAETPNDDRVNGPMAGGAYVATSDSRFGAKLREMGQTNSYVAVPLHDRYERY
jgi:hypothetical protein